MAIDICMKVILMCSLFAVFVHRSVGIEDQYLDHLIREAHEESTQLAKDIDNWTVTQKERLLSREKSRARRSIKTKAINDWTVTQTGGLLSRDQSREQPRARRSLKTKSINDWTVTQTGGLLSHDQSREQPRAQQSLDTLEGLGKEKRSVAKRRKRGGAGGKGDDDSLSKAMLELMTHPGNERARKKLKQAIRKAKKNLKKVKHKDNKTPLVKKKRKLATKARKDKLNRKTKAKSVKKKKATIPKKPNKNDRKSLISKPKEKGKSGHNKKVFIVKGVQTVTIDKKTMKIFKKIPKSTLHNLLKQSKLDKYLKLASYLSIGGKVDNKKKVYRKLSKKSHDTPKTLSKKIHDTPKTLSKKIHDRPIKETAVDKKGKVSKPKKLVKILKLLKQHEITKGKPGLSKDKVNDKESKSKEKVEKASKKDVVEKGKIKSPHSKKRNKVVTLSKHSDKKSSTAKAKQSREKKRNDKVKKAVKVIQQVKKGDKDRGKTTRKVWSEGKQETSATKRDNEIEKLKEKVKKANSLKFKVAKALLAHCETQNKLKKIFETVNASLKNAAKLAKAIGNKYGIKSDDVDKITTHHTQNAVEEFLRKIF